MKDNILILVEVTEAPIADGEADYEATGALKDGRGVEDNVLIPAEATGDPEADGLLEDIGLVLAEATALWET